MGSINSTSELSEAEASKMLEKLVPYDEVISERFGRVKIFKLNERVCKYYQRFREVGVFDEKAANRFRQKQEWYSSLKEHKNIVKIEFSKLTESTPALTQPTKCAYARSCSTYTPATTTTPSKIPSISS